MDDKINFAATYRGETQEFTAYMWVRDGAPSVMCSYCKKTEDLSGFVQEYHFEEVVGPGGAVPAEDLPVYARALTNLLPNRRQLCHLGGKCDCKYFQREFFQAIQRIQEGEPIDLEEAYRAYADEQKFQEFLEGQG